MTKRVIALIAGDSSTGKSFFMAHFPNALIYDTDIGGGLSEYERRIAANRSERVECSGYDEILDDLKSRQAKRQLSQYQSIIIDHLTVPQQESIARHEPNDGRSDFGRSNRMAAKEWRSIREFARAFDFNLICAAHLKTEYESDGPALRVKGVVADGPKNLEADFPIVLHLRPTSKYPATAWVKKWRRDPDPAYENRPMPPPTFPLTYEAFFQLVGEDLSAQRQPVELASAEQVAELKRLLEIVKIPDTETAKWLKKAGVETFDEMDAVTIGKCIDYVQKKAALAAGKEKTHDSLQS